MASKRMEEMKDSIAPKKIKLDDDLGSSTSGIVEDGIANEDSKKDIKKLQYHVIVHLDIVKEYWSSKEGMDALFSTLMEKVGSSRSQIRVQTIYSFIAFLTGDQAEEMSRLDSVLGVGQLTPYITDPH